MSHTLEGRQRAEAQPQRLEGAGVRDGGRQSKASRPLLWPKLDWRALSVPRVPTPWPLHPSSWTPRPGWLLLRGLSSPECHRLGSGLHLCGLGVCYFLLPLTYSEIRDDWGFLPLFFIGAVMGEVIGSAHLVDPWVTHRKLSLNQGQDLPGWDICK